MNQRDDPRQPAELFIRAARTEEERAFACVPAIILAVHDVVPTVDEQTKGKADEEHAEPERGRIPHRLLRDRQQIKPDGREPETRPRGLENEAQRAASL